MNIQDKRKVSWSEESREITLNCGADEIKLTADSGTAYLNGEAQMLDTAPTIINSRTMLPIRFIAESFKFGVDWNEKAQTVTITKSAGQAPSENNPAQPADKPDQTSKSLVVYFSATGNTKALAEKIAAESKSDIFEIVPKIPYTSEDLNYNNTDCRANTEQHDDSARPEISKMPENIADYDVIFIGYPIWWGTMPKIINTFLDSCDLSGKTVMPFYTSGGSGISASVTEIKKACPDADVRDGFKGSSGTSSAQLQSWLDGLQSKPQN